MAKVKYNGREINRCGITIDRKIFILLDMMIQKENQLEALCRSKIVGFRSFSKP
jgi:hypothetical protein